MLVGPRVLGWAGSVGLALGAFQWLGGCALRWISAPSGAAGHARYVDSWPGLLKLRLGCCLRCLGC